MAQIGTQPGASCYSLEVIKMVCEKHLMRINSEFRVFGGECESDSEFCFRYGKTAIREFDRVVAPTHTLLSIYWHTLLLMLGMENLFVHTLS